jgi:hypothetical protein
MVRLTDTVQETTQRLHLRLAMRTAFGTVDGFIHSSQPLDCPPLSQYLSSPVSLCALNNCSDNMRVYGTCD